MSEGKAIDDITNKYMSDINSNMSSKKKRHHRDKKKKAQTEQPVNRGAFLSGTSRRQAIDSQNEELTATYYITKIQRYLRERLENGQPPVSEEEINEYFQKTGNKNFEIASISGLKKILRNNIRINYIEKLYSFRADLEIMDSNQLLETLKQEKRIKTSELQGAYKGFKNDLNMYKEEGIIEELNSDEDKKNRLYFYLGPEYKEKHAPQVFRDLWKNAKIPDTTKGIEVMLINHGGKPMELVDPIEDLDSVEETQVKKRTRKSNRISKNQEFLDSIERDNLS